MFAVPHRLGRTGLRSIQSSLPLLALVSLATAAQAEPHTVLVGPNGSLQASNVTQTVVNQLDLLPGITGFNFSGSTGSYSAIKSDKDFFYAAFLIRSTAAIAESITTTLNNVTGVSELSERIYAYSGTFLGDAKAGPDIIQAWSSQLSVAGTSIAIIQPVSLPPGDYVLEIRGRNTGNFGGTLSMSPVPEPSQGALFLAGLAVMGLMLLRRWGKRD
ncbi:PEP-CTERM sorting domain-containing protein [Paucibacter sp. AS339]|uniref:PEP-CTERM sorting domain-containing protein n=1 Tax=Paucibacter hankyongi TaxID=3133434 RepID=UPI0030AA4D32